MQPYYAAHMAGGGWPEGFGNYGPLATLNMSLPAWEVKTATGADLVNATAPYTFPIDAGDYLMHFTWPTRAYIDDRDTNHSNGDADAPPPSSTELGMFMQALGVQRYWNAPHANVLQEYTNEVVAAREAIDSGSDDVDAWEEFLFYDPNGATSPLSTLPLSYFATGPNAVAARSDWSEYGNMDVVPRRRVCRWSGRRRGRLRSGKPCIGARRHAVARQWHGLGRA